MPNHCNNYLRVEGPRNAIEFFKAACYRPEDKAAISFNGLVPKPPLMDLTISGSDEKQRNQVPLACGVKGNWYDWCVKHWGTKWDAYNQEECEVPLLLRDHKFWKEQNEARVDKTPSAETFSFDTAWSPPGDWLRAASKMFSMLTFSIKWREEGGLSGILKAKKGRLSERALDDGDNDLPTSEDEG